MIVSQHIVYSYISSNLEDTWRTGKTTKAIGLIPIMLIPGIQNRTHPTANPSGCSRANNKQPDCFHRKSTKAKIQTRITIAAAVETTKSTSYEIYISICSKLKYKSTALQ
jgi:hypothetical protein